MGQCGVGSGNCSGAGAAPAPRKPLSIVTGTRFSVAVAAASPSLHTGNQQWELQWHVVECIIEGAASFLPAREVWKPPTSRELQASGVWDRYSTVINWQQRLALTALKPW